MEAIGGNADLGTHAELAAIGKLGRGIVQNDGAIDARQTSLGRFCIAGKDGFGVG